MLRRIETSLAYVPDPVLSIALIILGVLVGWAVHAVVFGWLCRLAERRSGMLRQIVTSVRAPARLALIMVFVAAAATVAPLTEHEAGIIRQINLVIIIALAGWAALTAMQVLAAVYLREYQLDAEDNLLARKHVTQLRILQRVMATLIVIVTIAAALMTFDGVRQYGVSLLASAGAAGLVVGLALQPLLKNLIAGIQLAITQPIRIDDALIVEGEWGNVEEITSTYVVLRIWDWRRLILPLSYFIEKPFQNWTREGSELIGAVMLYADYTLPVEALRAKVKEILEASAIWDRKVVAVQVTDFREATMEVRILASASTAGRVFDLRCEVREKIMAWLQAEHPAALPQRRFQVPALRQGGAESGQPQVTRREPAAAEAP